MNESYYDYLCEIFPDRKRFLEWIKLSLDNRVYHYGQHNKSPYEGERIKFALKGKISWLKHHFIDTAKLLSCNYNDSIISNAYFSINNVIKENYQLKVLPCPWDYCTDIFSETRLQKVISSLKSKSFAELLTDSFYKEVLFLYDKMRYFISNNRIKMVICYNDMYPMDRMAIDAGKELGVPTVVFLHGLPARYNKIDDNRADFLCVWGEGIKEQYVNVGVDPDRIIITGHPNLSTSMIPCIKEIDLSHPLVLTYVGCGVPSSSAEYNIGDRGNTINYPWCVECALKQVGVEHATLRPHPSEDMKWYKRFVDNDFYTIDSLSLTESLKKSTMVIGPTSTVAIEAAKNGVPYFGFSPYTKYGDALVPPFDNSESEFPVATSLKEFVSNIKEHKYMKPSVFDKYISSEFNLEPLINLIKE